MRITTFVFFDIETTGLPWQERNQTKIIEFSFVAALRKDIDATTLGNMPPVSKLTFVLNPQRPIHPKVVEMTGLSNDLLSYAPLFRQKIKNIKSFLQELPKPVCLVAHNGNTFDYKILLAELNDADTTLPTDLLCVDSLIGFRNILKGTNINYASLVAANKPSSSTDDLITDDEDDWPELNASPKEWDEIEELCLTLSDISCEDFTDEEKNKQDTEVRKKKVQAIRRKAIKTVFNKKPCAKNGTKNKAVKDSYKLIELYKRLLDKEEVNAHRAEADCLMLVQCVVALKTEFLQYADMTCKVLTEIQPLVRY